MKDFLLLKRDHFKVDSDGYATVVERPEPKQVILSKDWKHNKKRQGPSKQTCEVIQLD